MGSLYTVDNGFIRISTRIVSIITNHRDHHNHRWEIRTTAEVFRIISGIIISAMGPLSSDWNHKDQHRDSYN
jgi:hypothetical protein